MAPGDVTLKVTNNEDFDVGRGGHHFPALSQDIEVTVQHYRAKEITACSYLSTVIVGAEQGPQQEAVKAFAKALAESSPNAEVDEESFLPEATKAAKEKAEELGVDLAEVQGTGDEGKITVKDVKNAASNDEGDEPQGSESITEGQQNSDTVEPPVDEGV